MTSPQGKSPTWIAIAEATRSPDWPVSEFATPIHRELYAWKDGHWRVLAVLYGDREPDLKDSSLYVSKPHRSACPRPPGRGIARRLGLLAPVDRRQLGMQHKEE